MNNDGWIKIYIKLLQWEWYGDPLMVATLTHLLLKANWKDNKWRGVDVKRGQFITSRTRLAEEIGLTERKLRTCLERMQESGEITCETTNRYTVITICNYDRYQEKENTKRPAKRPTNDQQTTNKRPTNDQQTTTTSEVIEEQINYKSKEEQTGVPAPAREGDFDFETYGVMHNVKLKPAQYRHLVESYGEETAKEVIDDFSCKLADGSTNSANHFATIVSWLGYRRRMGSGSVPMSSKAAEQTPTYTPPKERQMTEAVQSAIDEWKQFEAERHPNRAEKYARLKEMATKHGKLSDAVLVAIGMKYFNNKWFFN